MEVTKQMYPKVSKNYRRNGFSFKKPKLKFGLTRNIASL